MHKVLMPFILGSVDEPPQLVVNAVATLLDLMPSLAGVPARLVGVGLRAEHAPGFAQRSVQA